MTKYEPQRHEAPDGSWYFVYRDQQRQSDAQAALDELQDANACIVLWVMDGDKAVAKIYKTLRDDELRYVIRLTPDRKHTPSLKRENERLGRHGEMRIHTSGVAVCDPLEAPDDRELEVSTREGVVRIDRHKVLERIALGQAKADLDEVRHA